MKIRAGITCPLELTHDMIRGKWKTIIIFHLQKCSSSLSKLQDSINGISQKMLIQHLNELREWGIVDKNSSVGYPLSVEYFLTDSGRKVLSAVQIMQEIGIEILVEQGKTEMLDKRGIPYDKATEQK